MLKYILLFILFLTFYLLSPSSQECIRFEFYENAVSNFGQSELIKHICSIKGGKVIDYSSGVLVQRGPWVINVTFHCCSRSYCTSDHDCPINFNCHQNKCQVASCPLTDDIDLVLQEGRECYIDEDCAFEIPYDFKHWKCLADPKCLKEKNCSRTYNFCKRCPSSNKTISPYIGPTPLWFIDEGDSFNETILSRNTTTVSPNITNTLVGFDVNNSLSSNNNVNERLLDNVNASGLRNRINETENRVDVAVSRTNVTENVNNVIEIERNASNNSVNTEAIDSNAAESNINATESFINFIESLNNVTEPLANSIIDYNNTAHRNNRSSSENEIVASSTSVNVIFANISDNLLSDASINDNVFTEANVNASLNFNRTYLNNSRSNIFSDNIRPNNSTLRSENVVFKNVTETPLTASNETNAFYLDLSDNEFGYIPPLTYLIRSLRSWNIVSANRSNAIVLRKPETNLTNLRTNSASIVSVMNMSITNSSTLSSLNNSINSSLNKLNLTAPTSSLTNLHENINNISTTPSSTIITISSLDVDNNSISSESNTLSHIENSNAPKNVTTLNATAIELLHDLEGNLTETTRNISSSLNETEISEELNVTTSHNSTHGTMLNSSDPKLGLVSNILETALANNKTLNISELTFKPNATESIFKPLPIESTFDPNLILRRNVTDRSSNLRARRNWTESRVIFNPGSHLSNNPRAITSRVNSFITGSELAPLIEYTSDDSSSTSSTNPLEFESTRRSRTSPSRSSSRSNEARLTSLNRPARRAHSYESRLRSWLDPNIVAIRYNPNRDRSNRPSRVPTPSSFITYPTVRPSTESETYTAHPISSANHSSNENHPLNPDTDSTVVNFNSTSSSPPPNSENSESVILITDEVNDV